MADTLGAKRRKQVGYFTDCPPWFKAEYSFRKGLEDMFGVEITKVPGETTYIKK